MNSPCSALVLAVMQNVTGGIIVKAAVPGPGRIQHYEALAA